MHKVYYLKTCSTCIRIIKELQLPNSFQFQDIKSNPITVAQLEEMRALTNSYESLFSKRAKRYKEMGLQQEKLTEKDYKHYILEQYTFLKRPVIIVGNKIFIGSAKSTVEAAKQTLKNE